MTASERFDVHASFPADPKHRQALEAMCVQAAACAGCADDVAKAFADEVGAAFSEGVSIAPVDAAVDVRLERTIDRFEAVVSCGRTVRIARPLPVPR